MDTYTINPRPFPRIGVSREEHRHRLALGVVTAIGTVIVGLLYWWSISFRSTVPTVTSDPQAQLRAEIISLLSKAPTMQASGDDIDRLVDQLSTKPADSTTSAERAALIKKLNTQ